jgi:hypothetical protein
LHTLRWDELYLTPEDLDPFDRAFSRSGQPIVPKAPAGLAAAPLRPLLTDRDPEVAAYAGYLLALLGEGDGLDRLLQHWSGRARTDTTWMRLVYRAIAAGNDDARVTVLETIYRRLQSAENELPEFYWTIRVMEGPNALQLRKQIRQEVGMDRLR